MNDIIEKISAYNIFNNLLPGVLFAVIGERFTSYTLLIDNLLIGVFIYYLYGLVISRIGSMLIEKFLLRVGFLKFAPYDEYLSASLKDPKIDQLSAENNMYRALISTFACLVALSIFESIEKNFPENTRFIFLIVVVLLIILFAFSYRKQTNYIKRRVNKINSAVKGEDNGD